MKESDLYRLRLEPTPEFQRRLRLALKAQERELPADSAAARRGGRALALTALTAVVATAMLMLTLPSVRAGAEALRELFRLTNCAAATIDRDRFNRLCHRQT
ncbi:MAG TPA: hypothetical protein VGG49_05875 [Steroidobacteraceae bacterium]|jgi:hypothetical protein